MVLDRMAHEIGRGFVAAAAGTAAMTVASTIEMKLRGRPPSDAPGKAASRLLRVRVNDDLATGRLPVLAHLVTGLSLGPVRGLLGFAGVREPAATGAYFAVSMTPDAVALPVMGIAPPPWRWGAGEVVISAIHHAIFAVATSAAYQALRSDG